MYKINANGGVIRLNDNSSIPEFDGNKHWRYYQEWLAGGNNPEPAFSKEEKLLNKINDIKADANRVILDRIPDTHQRNMFADVLENLYDGTIPLDPVIEADLKASWQWAKAVRAEAKRAIEEAAAAEDADTVQPNWPA